MRSSPNTAPAPRSAGTATCPISSWSADLARRRRAHAFPAVSADEKSPRCVIARARSALRVRAARRRAGVGSTASRPPARCVTPSRFARLNNPVYSSHEPLLSRDGRPGTRLRLRRRGRAEPRRERSSSWRTRSFATSTIARPCSSPRPREQRPRRRHPRRPTRRSLGNLFPEHEPSKKVADPVYYGGPFSRGAWWRWCAATAHRARARYRS